MSLPVSNYALTTVGNGTIPATAIVQSRIVTRTGPTGGFTDTTDTAANIAALMYGLPVGTTWTVDYINVSGQTATLAGGTGVTLSKNSGVADFTVANNVHAQILFTLGGGAAPTVTGQVVYRSAVQ